MATRCFSSRTPPSLCVLYSFQVFRDALAVQAANCCALNVIIYTAPDFWFFTPSKLSDNQLLFVKFL
jgi:hypothetical protein